MFGILMLNFIDGENIGFTPIDIEVLPAAITIFH